MRRWMLAGKGVETLTLDETEAPRPGSGEVLVRVNAVSLNYRDWAIVEESYPAPVKKPFVPASDMAGTVVETGPGVTRLRRGDRVTSLFKPLWKDGEGDAESMAATLGGPLPGVLTEYRVFPEDWLLSTPATLSDEEAATLPIAALTAWFALVDDGALQAGETVLAQGSGGVATFAIQIAKAMGARVLVTTGSLDKAAHLRQIGADVVIERGRNGAWADAVLKATNGLGVDHVLDVAGGAGMGASLRAVRIGGHVAVIGFLDDPAFSLTTPTVIYKRAKIQGVAVGHQRSSERMFAFFDEHRIRPVIERRYRFTEAPEAFAHLGRGAIGKLVIQVAE